MTSVNQDVSRHQRTQNLRGRQRRRAGSGPAIPGVSLGWIAPSRRTSQPRRIRRFVKPAADAASASRSLAEKPNTNGRSGPRTRMNSCVRSVQLFRDLQKLVDPWGLPRGEFVAVWHGGTVRNFRVEPIIADDIVASNYPFRAINLCALRDQLREPMIRLLGALPMRFGKTTIAIHDGVVDELIIEMRLRCGERLPPL
ncbi:MAG: hypothetical protein KDA75_19670 [Planctomycetaceae bacterium]|nr:hypothetical protein [Planctomycetaceae bacterium]